MDTDEHDEAAERRPIVAHGFNRGYKHKKFKAPEGRQKTLALDFSTLDLRPPFHHVARRVAQFYADFSLQPFSLCPSFCPNSQLQSAIPISTN
jgi:hypothetical protein